MHHTTGELAAIVHPELDADGRFAYRQIVEPHHRHEPRRLAFQVDDELVVRERADAVRVGDASERERRCGRSTAARNEVIGGT